MTQVRGGADTIAYEVDKLELERIRRRSESLMDRGLFSFACDVFLFSGFILANRLNQGGAASILLLALLVAGALCVYFGFQHKRLRLRYYNLDYRVQLEEEERTRGLSSREDQ